MRLEATEEGIVTPALIADLEKELASIQAEKEAAASAEDYERAAHMRQQELVTLTNLERSRSQESQVISLIVTPEHIAQLVETWTCFPVILIVESDTPNMRSLDYDLRTL